MSIVVNVVQQVNNTVAKRRQVCEDGTGLVINPCLSSSEEGKESCGKCRLTIQISIMMLMSILGHDCLTNKRTHRPAEQEQFCLLDEVMIQMIYSNTMRSPDS